MSFPMSSSRLPHPASGMSAVPDQRMLTIQEMAVHQHAAIHALRLFGDSVNQSGELPLNEDYLVAQIQSAQCHIQAMSLCLGALSSQGHTVKESDLQEIFEEPITALLPNEPIGDVEGGAK